MIYVELAVVVTANNTPFSNYLLLMYKKIFQFKHSVKDDQIIRQKLQISIFVNTRNGLHVTWNDASVDTK
jgi:hypothetical protein